MNRAQIAEELRSFLTREFPNEEIELTEETNLLEDWLVDSLALTQVVVFAEERFGVQLTGADFNAANFQDIAAISRLIGSRLDA